ncbi:MAG: helix-turn-helix domain-containing protein [Nanoarchaeota archaeon]
MKEELQTLGLTEGESRTYLALLKLGSTTVGPLVKESKISYSKIYEVLGRLIEKGFATYIIKEKTKQFRATRPGRIRDYLAQEEKTLTQKKKIFATILPELNQWKQSGKRDAEVFIGFNGLKSAYEQLLIDCKKREPLRYFYVHDEENIAKAELFYTQLFHYFKKLGLHLQGITSTAYKKSPHFKKPPRFITLRYVDFPLPSTIDIYQDRILISSWKGQILGFLIQSEEIAANYRDNFDEVWKVAKK